MAKKQLTPNQQIIDNDIMRFKTNSKASSFIYLGLVFEFLFFLCVYGQQANNDRTATFMDGTNVYTYVMGISVILNLVVLLVGFLASQEIKNYSKLFSYIALAIAVVQIVRIFIYPLQTYTDTLSDGTKLFGTYSFVFMIIWLVLSAASFAASGVFGILGATKREKFLKQLDAGEVDLEAAYKEEDAPVEEAAVAEEVSANA